MASKVPFTAGKSFSELGVIGKVTTVATVVSAVVGCLFGIWQFTAFAGERTELYIADIVQNETPKILEVELQSYQQQQQFYYYGNQMQILRLERRAIESEMSSITRGKTPDQLTADDVSRLDTLRADRQQINNQLHSIQQRQQQQQNQQQRQEQN